MARKPADANLRNIAPPMRASGYNRRRHRLPDERFSLLPGMPNVAIQLREVRPAIIAATASMAASLWRMYAVATEMNAERIASAGLRCVEAASLPNASTVPARRIPTIGKDQRSWAIPGQRRASQVFLRQGRLTTPDAMPPTSSWSALAERHGQDDGFDAMRPGSDCNPANAGVFSSVIGTKTPTVRSAPIEQVQPHAVQLLETRRLKRSPARRSKAAASKGCRWQRDLRYPEAVRPQH